MFDFPAPTVIGTTIAVPDGSLRTWDGVKWRWPASGSGVTGSDGVGGPFVPAINPLTGVPGIFSFPSYDIYQSPDSYALTGSMTIRGQPYGYYDTGALLSMVATTLPVSSSRAGINGGWEQGVTAIAGYAGLDSVNLYSGIGAQPPLVLHNVTYDATHVIPQTPLTTAQLQVLRHNMYVLTNSIDTTVSTTPSVPNGQSPENRYASFITGWAADGTSITVVGWTVPGSGHTASGQVPPVGTLSPGAVNATAYFGAPTNAFGANFMAQHNPASWPDSRIKTYQGIEFDFQNYGTVDYEMAVQGLSLNYDPINGTVKPTADSYGMKLSGFPTGLIINYTPIGGVAIQTDAFNALTQASPSLWAGTPTANLIWEAAGYIDSNVLRLQNWVSRDVAGGGWPTASMHLGLFVDRPELSLAGGSPMASIVWNAQGFDGGLQFRTPTGSVLSFDAAGWIYPQVGNAANDAAAASLGVPVGAMYRNGSVLMVRVS
jgi:hypothetical protein